MALTRPFASSHSMEKLMQSTGLPLKIRMMYHAAALQGIYECLHRLANVGAVPAAYFCGKVDVQNRIFCFLRDTEHEIAV